MVDASSTFTIEVEVDATNAQRSYANFTSQLRNSTNGLDAEINKIEKGTLGAASAAGKAETATRGWAQSMAAVYKAQLQAEGLDRTDVEKRSKQQAIYNQYLHDESKATNARVAAEGKSIAQADRAIGQRDAHVKSFQAYNQQAAAASKQTALYNQYLYDQEKAANRAAQGLSTTRYALYDVSSTLAVTGAALLGLAVGTAAVAIAWERDFANVARTSGEVGTELQGLRADFVDLAQTMPTAFADLTQIGTLGSQLGVAADDLAGFTQTVVRFSTATGISAQESAMAFGRLGNILDVSAENYERLGSSIAFAGLKAVATEAEIVAVAQQIGPIARLSGVAADGVIGLATAMASVKIPPELARSVITKTFGDIQKSVETASPKLTAFGEVAGMSGEQFAKAWKTDATGAFVELLKGITTNGDGAYAALDKIGITSRRDTPAILKLAQNYDLVSEALGNSKTGWEEGTELARQYSIIADTTSAKLQVLANNFMALLDAIGSANLGPLKTVIDGLSGFLGMLTDFAGTDIGGPILGVAAVLAGLLGVLALAAGGMALFGASSIGVQQAMLGLIATAPRASAMILGAGTASAVASGQMTAAAASAKLLGTALKILSVIGVALLLPDIAEWADTGIRAITGVSIEYEDMRKRFLDTDFSFGQNIADRAPAAIAIIRSMGDAASRGAGDIKRMDEELAAMVEAGSVGAAQKEFADLKAEWLDAGGSAEGFVTAFTDTNNALKEVGSSSGTAKDGMSGLEGALAQVETDAQEAETAINELHDAIINFGATSITAEQGAINLQRSLNEMAAAATNADATLYGTNDASLALRDSFIDTNKSALEAAAGIAANGGTLEDATAAYLAGREAIIQTRIARGEDEGAARAWADTVFGASSEAQGAVAAYIAKVNEVPATKTTLFYADIGSANETLRNFLYRVNTSSGTVRIYTQYVQGAGPLLPDAPIFRRAQGGPIYGPGTPTSDSIPAMLSNGEWVIKAASVQKYGSAFMHAINSGRVPKFAGGGSVGSSGGSDGTTMMGGVIELGPKSLARLGQSVTNNIMINDEAISRAAERGNAKRRQQGELR